MGDIVKQLRKHHRDVGLSDDVESWLTVSADEIERLREALREISTRNFPEGTATLELRKIARAALGEDK